MTAPAPSSFTDPWQAELFALTVALSDAGQFSWPAWTEAFGATLRRHGANRMLDGDEDYFAAWLETLETLLATSGAAPSAETAKARAAWEQAYRTTPHGQPVQPAL
ncbi:nitrile hydratase accessory protein [Frigidibacter sp. SD6-1]|uniref:nitrile hydratase accessory protein n=1 Tax=Frigidibacter sp. SD6-1 TaxID=3032581 RepID=UPI0024E00D20|nr:nitrile hydratase accessory protein [Frigidibacter sp. SD6-1]